MISLPGPHKPICLADRGGRRPLGRRTGLRARASCLGLGRLSLGNEIDRLTDGLDLLRRIVGDINIKFLF